MLLKRLLGRGELSVWYGQPKTGKSFLVTDAALTVAAEAEQWFSYRVKQPGMVVYCVLEGAGGFGSRLDAWSIKHGRDVPDNFVWTPVRLAFVTEQTQAAVEKDVQRLMALIRFLETRQNRTCSLVVVDTTARAMSGTDENSTQVMTAFVAQCAHLQDMPSTPHVAVVHHENAGGTKPRGSTSLLGAGDTFIRVQKNDKGQRSWTLNTAKDDEDGARYGFALESVMLGFDEDDDILESCVVVEAPLPAEEPRGKKGKQEKPDPAPKPPRKPVGANQQLVLEALREVLFDTPDARPSHIDAPAGVAVVTKETWWRVARERLPHDDERKAREAFREALEGLVGRNFVGHHQRIYCSGV
jgi:hypothetical protein